MEIIPEMDIKNGCCVRLLRGSIIREVVYSESPLTVARHWVEQGATRLNIVDLDGARTGRLVHIDVIAAIARGVSIPVQVGGGIGTSIDVEHLLKIGVDRVIVSTGAAQRTLLLKHLIKRYGDAIIVAIDARNGWVVTDSTGIVRGLEATTFANTIADIGARRIIYTDIERDGTLFEPNFDITQALLQLGRLQVSVAGGVASMSHIERLAALGCESTIIGRALYAGIMRLSEAQHVAATMYRPLDETQLRAREAP